MGRELPTMRSLFAMLALVGGAFVYVLTDAHFVVHGYVWVAIWYCIFCFDQLYIKHAVDNVKMRSNWGRVFYTNLWASLMLLVMTVTLEPQVLSSMDWTYKPIAALIVSCLAGVAMSYFAFLCRAAVSATSFTVVGNVCKILTVLINISIWDKHASPIGLGALLLCLVAAAAYQQSPKRAEAAAEQALITRSEKDEAASRLVQEDTDSEDAK